MENMIHNYYHTDFCKDHYICNDKHIVYQYNYEPFEYGLNYFKHYTDLDNTGIAFKLNQCRINLVEKYISEYMNRRILDFGVGSGEFIRKLNSKKIVCALGYDINDYGISFLKSNDLFYDIYKFKALNYLDGICFWDSLEHLQNPCEILSYVEKNKYVFISMPIFDNQFETLLNSKHFKPNEHLYYFSINGLINFMKDMMFDLIEINTQETIAGRESIYSFVFIKK